MAPNPKQNQPRSPRGAPDEVLARTLIYFPIIHTQADLGALQESVLRATLEKLGRAGTSRKMAVIDQVWSDIQRLLDSQTFSFDRVRLYQDGLPVCGREREIVEELARTGSRNHQLLLRLMGQGAVLMGTESSDLLVREYQLAKQSYAIRPPRAAGLAARRQDVSNALLQRRDQFVAQRIDATLKAGETGILFMGMLHTVDRYLPKDIRLIYPQQRPR